MCIHENFTVIQISKICRNTVLQNHISKFVKTNPNFSVVTNFAKKKLCFKDLVPHKMQQGQGIIDFTKINFMTKIQLCILRSKRTAILISKK